MYEEKAEWLGLAEFQKIMGEKAEWLSLAEFLLIGYDTLKLKNAKSARLAGKTLMEEWRAGWGDDALERAAPTFHDAAKWFRFKRAAYKKLLMGTDPSNEDDWNRLFSEYEKMDACIWAIGHASQRLTESNYFQSLQPNTPESE